MKVMSEYYENLKNRFRDESKKQIWENAKYMYEECKSKKYKSVFGTQENFANYLGITKGRISQYRYAYEYYLFYKDEIDITKYSVEQAYDLHRLLGRRLDSFLKWLEENRNVKLEECSIGITIQLITEYNRRTQLQSKNFEQKKDIILNEHEKDIICYYRLGTDIQRTAIDEIIKSIRENVVCVVSSD